MSNPAIEAPSPTWVRPESASVRRTESLHRDGPGRGLFRRSWTTGEIRRAILIVHGFAEHSGRYDAFGEWFARRGCAVHGFDLRGHGRSPGSRGHVGRFEDYLDDLDGVLSAVRAEHPDLPCTIVGHSMGGLIAAALAETRAPQLTALVTSGALLAFPETPSGLRRWFLRALRRVAPRLPLAAGVSPDGLSRDPQVVRQYRADPLVFRRATAALAAEIGDAVERTARAASRVRVPMLLLHGADDPLCPAHGSQAFSDGLSVPGSELRLYPGLRHEIFNEPEREQVFADLLAWLEARG